MSERLSYGVCRSEDLLRAILESATDGIVFVDPEGAIREWGRAAERIFGLSRDEVLGSDAKRLELDGPAEDPTAKHRNGEPKVSVRSREVGGRALALVLLSRRVNDAEGRPLGTLSLVRDVSEERRHHADLVERERALSEALRALRGSHEELKNTQLQLIQSAKLESMGRVAAGVAHEVKNPLAVILTGIQLLQRRLHSADPVVTETLADLENSVRRANRIVIGLLDYAASLELRLEAVDLDEVVSASIQLVHHETQRRHIRVERVESANLPELELDRTKIEQVLVNLMMNAMDAMDDGGTLTVRTSMRQLTAPGHGIGFRKSDVLRVGQTVAAIEIEDTGSGIPAETLARVFDPFFTTKLPGKGAGLGLAVCRTIVGLHRGAIWLENRPEGGTRATVVLRAGETRKE